MFYKLSIDQFKCERLLLKYRGLPVGL